MKDVRLSEQDRGDLLAYLDKESQKASVEDTKKIPRKLEKKVSHIKKRKRVPEYVKDMVRIARDLCWLLENKELENHKRRRVIAALNYFIVAEDKIADYIPVVGYLDDAYVLSVVHHEMKDDLSDR